MHFIFGLLFICCAFMLSPSYKQSLNMYCVLAFYRYRHPGLVFKGKTARLPLNFRNLKALD